MIELPPRRCSSAVDRRLVEYCNPSYNLLVKYIYVGCARHYMPDMGNLIDGVQQRGKRSAATEQNRVSRATQRNKLVPWNTDKDQEQRQHEQNNLEGAQTTWRDFRYALLVWPKRQRARGIE